MICSTVLSNCLQILHSLPLCVCNIVVAWYLVCNVWFCAIIIIIIIIIIDSSSSSSICICISSIFFNISVLAQ